MQRIVEVGDVFVGTIDGQRVLDQVIGTDRNEVEPAQEQADRQRGRRHFNHAADLDVLVERDLLAAQTRLRLLKRRQGLVDLMRVRKHRNQDPDLADLGHAQNRAQLMLLAENEQLSGLGKKGVRIRNGRVVSL